MRLIQRLNHLSLAIKGFLFRSPCLIMDLLTMALRTMVLLTLRTTTSLHLNNSMGLEWVTAWRDRDPIALCHHTMHRHIWHIDQ